MRTVLGLATLTAAMAGGAACADTLPLDLSLQAPATRFAATVVPLLPPLEHVELFQPTAIGGDPFDPREGLFRHRFASSMVDIYPSQGSGFHASFGTRFYKEQYLRHDQEGETHGLLYSPRLPHGAPGLRGFRRATPAATFGYTETIRSNFVVGMEAGTLLGRVVQPLYNPARLPGGVRDGNAFRANPVLNLTVGYAF